MKKTNINLGFRTLQRNKLYTILNMLGLSIGMASAILIFLWVQFQVGFDRFHENTRDIYRVIQDQYYTNGEVFHVNVTPTGISRLLRENISSITHCTRYNGENVLVQAGETKLMEKVQLVDPDFFTMFSFPLIKGTPDKVFENTHSMVISEKMAAKYFGDKNPIGEIITLETKYPFTVTGIIQDKPLNTEISYDFLVPFTFYKEFGANLDDMGSNWITTYVQLAPGSVADSVNNTIEAYKKKAFPDAEAVFFLQPLKNIHLYWIWGGGPIKNVRLFSLIAALIILIAAINFTNLSTAMATKRFKEIGVKKSFGADRRSLISQFLSETIILAIISMFVALILAESFLPWFNHLLQTQLSINYGDWQLITGLVVIMLVTGILSGAYPALYLSSFRPINILKSTGRANKRSLLRETLVILQFGLAIVLIVNTLIIKKQQHYMQTRDVGIQKENILYIPVRGDLKEKYELFKAELKNDPDILSVTFSSHLPTGIWSNGGDYKWQGKPPEVDPLVSNTFVDFDYARTFGIKMAEGSFYSNDRYEDTTQIVINKAFADIIKLKPILGEVLDIWGMKLKIIGVTDNFNFKPLSSKVEPLVLICSIRQVNYVSCKIMSSNIQKTIHKIEEAHNLVNGNFPFEYHFFDEEYDNMYKGEIRQGQVFNIFSFLAIFISCLGLFGLSSFMMTQRTKEIGIRKANGAATLNVMALFAKYYVRWIIVSFIIAVPVSYYFAHTWLKNYAYRTTLNWWIFVLAGVIAFIIALITVGWQSWKAARKNPVEALRYE
jgi:putative ABC transport system permease protein